MLKCNIDRKKNRGQVKSGGTGEDITMEVLALIGKVYRGIRRSNKDVADCFKSIVIAGVLDPNSPVWKEE